MNLHRALLPALATLALATSLPACATDVGDADAETAADELSAMKIETITEKVKGGEISYLQVRSGDEPFDAQVNGILRDEAEVFPRLSEKVTLNYAGLLSVVFVDAKGLVTRAWNWDRFNTAYEPRYYDRYRMDVFSAEGWKAISKKCWAYYESHFDFVDTRWCESAYFDAKGFHFFDSRESDPHDPFFRYTELKGMFDDDRLRARTGEAL